ncbi:MAG: amidohydrolase family protein [Bacteroidota bacterium]
MNRRKFTQKLILASPVVAACTNIWGQHIEKIDDIPKTDTHVHLFDLDNFSYSWLNNAPEINRNFGISDFREASKEVNIGKIVFMESGADAGFGVKEANWVAGLAQKEPRIKGIIAKLALDQGRETAQTLDQLAEVDLLRGIRGPFPEGAHESSLFFQGLELLAERNLSFDFLLSTPRLASAIKVAQKCPQNVFVLDHLGNPDIPSGDSERWKKGIKQLAAQPNVNCKLSGIITRIGKDWSREEIEPYILYVIDQFGMDRLVYGGDWPVVLRAGSYQSWASVFEEITKQFSKIERQKMYHLNADRIYRLA